MKIRDLLVRRSFFLVLILAFALSWVVQLVFGLGPNAWLAIFISIILVYFLSMVAVVTFLEYRRAARERDSSQNAGRR